MILIRPDDARIPRDETEDNARALADFVERLDECLYEVGLDEMTEDQRAALWCADPADTFAMLDDWVARLGLPAERVNEVTLELFDLLPESDKQHLRTLEVWGIV